MSSFIAGTARFDPTSQTSNATTTPLNVAAGDTIVVGSRTGINAVLVTSVTDTAGNVYRQAGVTLQSAQVEVWYCTNCIANAANIITVNYSAGNGNSAIAVAQFRGLATISPLDVNVNSRASALNITSPNFTTAVADSVLIAYAIMNSTAGVWTPDTGWTQACVDAQGVNIIQYKIVTAIQTGVNTTMTNTVGADKAMIVISLHETIGGGGGGSTLAAVF